MDGEEFQELESSMSKVRRSCKYLKYICMVCLIVFSVAWAALVGVMVFSSKTQVSSSELREVVYVICCGLMVILLLFAAARSFSDIVNGESPFTMKQVNRFRFAALLLVLLAIVDAILSTNFLYGFDVAGFNVAAYGGHEMGQAKVNVNMMLLFFSAMLFGVSVLFRYGVLLQRLTDETE